MFFAPLEGSPADAGNLPQLPRGSCSRNMSHWFAQLHRDQSRLLFRLLKTRRGGFN